MNKLLVLTGGTKGIGRAIAEHFAHCRFDVITCSRNKQDLQDMKRDVESAVPGIQVMVFRADMANKGDITAFSKFVQDFKRPIDVLVNNAGFFVPGEILTEPEGTLESMIAGNLYSAYHMTRAIAPLMKMQKSGHIFNICSVASLMAYKNGGSYAISKFALLGFSKCIREELKPVGVKVTAVLPGATFTRSWEQAGYPEDRFMTTQDIAKLVYATYDLSPGSVVEELLIRPQLGDI